MKMSVPYVVQDGRTGILSPYWIDVDSSDFTQENLEIKLEELVKEDFYKKINFSIQIPDYLKKQINKSWLRRLFSKDKKGNISIGGFSCVPALPVPDKNNELETKYKTPGPWRVSKQLEKKRGDSRMNFLFLLHQIICEMVALIIRIILSVRFKIKTMQIL